MAGDTKPTLDVGHWTTSHQIDAIPAQSMRQPERISSTMGMAAKAIPFRVTRGVSCKQKADVLSVNVELRHAKRRAVASLSLLARQGLFFKVVCLRLPKGRLHPMRDAQSVAKTWVPGYWSTSSHLAKAAADAENQFPAHDCATREELAVLAGWSRPSGNLQ
eukprot:CAMPEP_0181176796 /NCGR_PEP_ID=MMETSP1096-20121128/4818_1 /TAXON_ID=156174 ORGANISM="Chrysochromulina ericina, Strain CCMP281" /NCGR_SAMPLE_ID=MMETSP1096 /ASSEMBLY_ACC=CAM_ASM_000453 /LENGTH=161 /DNA_ID=CAMNT_0023264903 /DNA_START=108 /DNA_END=594 /DNA_ORIENTATION=-